jgi:hypothetical protein
MGFLEEFRKNQEESEDTPFLVEFRNNLPEIEKLLEAWFVRTIHENRPWWKYTTKGSE